MLSTERFQSSFSSPLPEASDRGWSSFVETMEVQPADAISSSGGLGAFDMRPRRIVELGFAKNLQTRRLPGGRQVHTCEFIAPWTLDRFLSNPLVQYGLFWRSTVEHYNELRHGVLKRSEGLSLAGALAILHRGGRGALAAFPELFEETERLFQAAQGAF